MPGKTWCSYELKGKVSNAFEEEIDPDGSMMVCIGKRRDESPARANTPEFVKSDKYHGDRDVWHPLAFVTEHERDAILCRAGIEILPHRSQECAPCINANRADFKVLTEIEIERAVALEMLVGKTMFRPAHHMGAKGIREVIRWAYSPRGKYELEHESCERGYCE